MTVKTYKIDIENQAETRTVLVEAVCDRDAKVYAMALSVGTTSTVEEYDGEINPDAWCYITPAAALCSAEKLANSETTGWLEGYADGEKAGREAGYRIGYQDGRKARAKNDRKHQPKPARMFRYYDEEE